MMLLFLHIQLTSLPELISFLQTLKAPLTPPLTPPLTQVSPVSIVY